MRSGHGLEVPPLLTLRLILHTVVLVAPLLPAADQAAQPALPLSGAVGQPPPCITCLGQHSESTFKNLWVSYFVSPLAFGSGALSPDADSCPLCRHHHSAHYDHAQHHCQEVPSSRLLRHRHGPLCHRVLLVCLCRPDGVRHPQLLLQLSKASHQEEEGIGEWLGEPGYPRCTRRDV